VHDSVMDVCLPGDLSAFVAATEICVPVCLKPFGRRHRDQPLGVLRSHTTSSLDDRDRLGCCVSIVSDRSLVLSQTRGDLCRYRLSCITQMTSSAVVVTGIGKRFVVNELRHRSTLSESDR